MYNKQKIVDELKDRRTIIACNINSRNTICAWKGRLFVPVQYKFLFVSAWVFPRYDNSEFTKYDYEKKVGKFSGCLAQASANFGAGWQVQAACPGVIFIPSYSSSTVYGFSIIKHVFYFLLR